MLIEFTRAPRAFQLGSDGDEEATEGFHEVRISLNPEAVAAVFAARDTLNTCIVRMSDGRGFYIQGNYDEVIAVLRPYHSTPTPLRVV
jgi:hypothetical protein